jgi:A/G-specific adenine glycosylase
MMPNERPGDFVQAMMDLGATICRPKNPHCGNCPLSDDCAAFRIGNPEDFPQRTARAPRPHRYGVAYWIERSGQLWLIRRPSRGLLGGMAALPGEDWTDARPAAVNAIATVRHVFTHFSLDLLIVPRAETFGDGWWHSLDHLDEAGLPTLYRKAVEATLASHDRLAA